MSRYNKLNERVLAYEKSVNNRAKQLCKEAGLDPNLLGLHPHNAMVSYKQGKPWKGVDYKKVRKVLWLTNVKQWEARRILEKYVKRLDSTMPPMEVYNYLFR